jgi:predicted DCC family thiol-disulfide oxidoreductase YuxK
MVWDGDCNFCRFWILRLHRRTREGVEYVEYQNPRIRELAAEISREQFEEAVQLILPDGRVLSGAEAIFVVLANYGNLHWPLAMFRRVPGAAAVANLGYRFIASHRGFFSWVTRVIWGRTEG